MDKLNVWLGPTCKGTFLDTDALNRICLPKGKQLRLVKTRIAAFLNELVAASLYHQPVFKEVMFYNTIVSGYLCVGYETKVLVKKHKYTSMIYKGVKKLEEDIKYYARYQNKLILTENMLTVQLILRDNKVESKQEVMVYQHGKLLYRDPEHPAGRAIEKEEMSSILAASKNEEMVLSIFLWYEPKNS